MLERLENAGAALSRAIWGPALLGLLLGTGVWFTLRSRAFQLTYARAILRRTLLPALRGRKQDGAANGISPLQAMSTVLAATIGVGNIAGVAAAIVSGGPGAVFWLWAAAFFGMMTSFAENALGLYYRQKDAAGGWRGGAMYYLADGLRRSLFCSARRACSRRSAWAAWRRRTPSPRRSRRLSACRRSRPAS